MATKKQEPRREDKWGLFFVTAYQSALLIILIALFILQAFGVPVDPKIFLWVGGAALTTGTFIVRRVIKHLFSRR